MGFLVRFPWPKIKKLRAVCNCSTFGDEMFGSFGTPDNDTFVIHLNFKYRSGYVTASPRLQRPKANKRAGGQAGGGQAGAQTGGRRTGRLQAHC